MNQIKNIKVAELFAGVGGFRLGLERSSQSFEIIWANQWEPNKKKQHAFDCYVYHYGTSPTHVNKDISLVKDSIPDHNLLVGGFPCQDYSVARTSAKGIEGNKGSLWWQIYDIAAEKRPQYILLENVDRLIKSPKNQKGRDFAVMLRSLDDLGYAVEWRVINAAEYGYAQRRRRVFLFAYYKDSGFYNRLIHKSKTLDECTCFDWINTQGFFCSPFPISTQEDKGKKIIEVIGQLKYNTIEDVFNHFESKLLNAGIMVQGTIYSTEVVPVSIEATPLKQIRQNEIVDSKYFLTKSLERWKYLKGSKSIPRLRPNGSQYMYTEGKMCFPDNLDLPSRTILTSESSISRSSHVIEDKFTGRLRILTPIECERLQGFPDNWTDTGMPEKFRYFVMGNALVVPLVVSMGKRILEIFDC